MSAGAVRDGGRWGQGADMESPSLCEDRAFFQREVGATVGF